MIQNTDIPYSTIEGIDYLIKFTLFSSDKIPEYITIPIVDIVIETNSDVNEIKNSAYSLIQISKLIGTFILNNDAIFYCYCSDKPIKKSLRKGKLTNQEYRSMLFCKMFEKSNNSSFINKIVVISDSQRGNHYLHLITASSNINMINQLAVQLTEFDK